MRKYKLIISRIALNDLQELYDHIAQNLNEPIVAENIHRSVVKAIRSLSDLPLRHKLVDAEPYRTQGFVAGGSTW